MQKNIVFDIFGIGSGPSCLAPWTLDRYTKKIMSKTVFLHFFILDHWPAIIDHLTRSWDPSRIVDLEEYFQMVVSRMSHELSDTHSCLDKVWSLVLPLVWSLVWALVWAGGCGRDRTLVMSLTIGFRTGGFPVRRFLQVY